MNGSTGACRRSALRSRQLLLCERDTAAGSLRIGEAMRRRAKRKQQVAVTPATVPDAIRFLASVCDGARRRDGWGFGADHVALGHSLARIPTQCWSPAMWQWAWLLVRCYRQQLQRAGFDLDELRGATRRSRRPKRLKARQVPCWATDPFGFAMWRWWNGCRWTEHVAHRSDPQPGVGVAPDAFFIAHPMRNDRPARADVPERTTSCKPRQ